MTPLSLRERAAETVRNTCCLVRAKMHFIFVAETSMPHPPHKTFGTLSSKQRHTRRKVTMLMMTPPNPFACATLQTDPDEGYGGTCLRCTLHAT